MNTNRLLPLAIALSCIGIHLPAFAENLPGDFIPRPAGTNSASIRLTHSWADATYKQGERIDADFRYRQELTLLTLAHYGGESTRWGIAAGLPYGRTQAESDPLRLDAAVTGLADPYLLAGFWPLIGDNYYLAVGGRVYMPLGSYEPGRAVNQGNNVWSWTGEANLAWTPLPAWTLELSATLRGFSDNDDYGASRGTLERASRQAVELHITRTLFERTRLSLDYFYERGGETTLNGQARDDAWNDQAIQLTGSWGLGNGRAITAWYRNALQVQERADTQTLGVRFSQAF